MDTKPKVRNSLLYETDLLISEQITGTEWTPRLIIEAKINSVTTHDAITYSQKAQSHKAVHPYLRYGIIIGNRKHYPLPGRLFRHGSHFDFMLSWVAFEPTESDLDRLLHLITVEVEASQKLEEAILDSRNTNREKYTCLHRPLLLLKPDESK
jgi:hypothetical protein